MLAKHAGISDHEILEKDVRLHMLLKALTEESESGPHLVFKGGTCLIKCYLDYPRFSTDLDFTWSHGKALESMSAKEFRRTLRPLQRTFLEALQKQASDQGLEFDPATDVQYGQSNRMMTIMLRYLSIARLPGLIKVQINFVELLMYPPKRVDARGLLGVSLPSALALLDSDLPSRYASPIPVDAYDAREILAEKGRALLTRQAAKMKDILDLFLLETQMGLRVEDHMDAIEAKTKVAVEGARRYREHLRLVESRFDLLREEDFRRLLLKPLDEDAFETYRRRVLGSLSSLVRKMHA